MNRLSEKKKVEKKKRCLCMSKIQAKVFMMIDSNFFNILIICLIVVNTLFLSLEHYE